MWCRLWFGGVSGWVGGLWFAVFGVFEFGVLGGFIATGGFAFCFGYVMSASGHSILVC